MRPLPRIACLFVLTLFAPAAAEGQRPAKSPLNRRIQDLHEHVKDLRAKADVPALKQLGADVKAEWLKAKSSEYFPVIFDICLALNSCRTAEPGIAQTIEDLALAALESPLERPLAISAHLLLFLTGDADYTNGRLRGDAWAQERRIRVERWLKVAKSARVQNAAAVKPKELPYMRVSPPAGTGLPDGAGPESVKDPVLRKQFEEAIARNSKLIEAHSKKRDLEELEEFIRDTAQIYFADTYSKPPFRTVELKTLLEKYDVPKNNLAAILENVRRREAAWIERERKFAKLTGALAKTPSKKLQYRVDEAPFEDAPFPLYVQQGTAVTFKVPTGDSWVWTDPTGARGKGNSKTVNFAKLSKDRFDWQTIAATSGRETFVAHVVVFELELILTPRDNFPGRDLDAYGVGEFIFLSYKTEPPGIDEADIGELRWVIKNGGGDLYGATGGLATYQVDVGPEGSFVVALRTVGRPVGNGARKK
jgi:hypothetical protein